MKRFYLSIVTMVLAFFAAGSVYADKAYIVKKGDNPSRLAKKYKVSAREIMEANGLEAGNLKPGMRITIPSKKKDGHSRSKAVKAKDRQAKREKNAKGIHDGPKEVSLHEGASFHVVKKGETLLSISRKYSISVHELKEMNGIRTKRLKAGQRLIVKQNTPRTYTVRKGDTVWNIAKRFNLDPDELMDINELESDSLKPGQKIILSAATEAAEPKTYDMVLSQAHVEKELEQISGSKEISQLGLRDRVTLFAKKLLNIPYRFGGNSLFGIDCSAYVKKVYSLIGIDLPRSAREQFNEGEPVDGEPLSIGDLVFFRTYASFPSHVGIYLGNNLFIHASSRSKKVTIDNLDAPYYLKRFIGAKRLLDVKDVKDDPQKEG